MTPIADLLAAATPVSDGFRVTVPTGWMQGRTAYGGLSGALALHAAQISHADLPPLRSALVAFVGPLAGEVTVTATLLRRGRNAAFVQADITGDAGLGYRATYVFMANRDSRVALDARAPAGLAPPAADAALYTGPDGFFTGNFDFLDCKQGADGAALGGAEWLRWARLRAREGLDPMVEIMAVADALPPAAFKLLGQDPAPVSSLGWQVNLLTPSPRTTDGWWLLHARTAFAQGGSSSQSMRAWNAAGEMVAEGMQSVALFG